jgi:D-beta-D-heptose 7-phosphate kinase/D-beta-D-heptose 1-phosphate adenosyltransferase
VNPSKKVINIAKLSRIAMSLKRRGKKVIFTNGCFDIIHFGHVSYLEKAKGNNRVLIIGLNSDTSVRKNKGPHRPINSQKARATILAALQSVDFVTIFGEETPLKLIQAIKPDFLIKGADWKGKRVVGADVVDAYGGRVEFIKYIDGFSSTKMIEKIGQCAHPK